MRGRERLAGLDEARLHLRRDVRVVRPRADVGHRPDDDLVVDAAHFRRRARDLGDRADEVLRRHLARQKHDTVVARHVDVHAIAVTGADVVGDLELDRLVIRLRADRAAIARDQRRAGDRAADDQRHATGEKRRHAGNGGECGEEQAFRHASSPSNVASITSHRQWMVSR